MPIDDFVVGDCAPEASYRQRRTVRVEFGEIFRQLDQYGARFFGSCHTHRLAHHFRNVVGMTDARGPFRDRLKHADDVHHLV